MAVIFVSPRVVLQIVMCCVGKANTSLPKYIPATLIKIEVARIQSLPDGTCQGYLSRGFPKKCLLRNDKSQNKISGAVRRFWTCLVNQCYAHWYSSCLEVCFRLCKPISTISGESSPFIRLIINYTRLYKVANEVMRPLRPRRKVLCPFWKQFRDYSSKSSAINNREHANLSPWYQYGLNINVSKSI